MRPSALTRQLSVLTWGIAAARYGCGSPRWSRINRVALNRRRVVPSVAPPPSPSLEASKFGSTRIAVTSVRPGWLGAAGAAGAFEAPLPADRNAGGGVVAVVGQ